jgi:asparagine synthase (glutamine-hydrolysing)
MCGIFYIHHTSEEVRKKIGRMLTKAVYRGPDGQNALFFDQFSIAHNLLAIHNKVTQPIETENYVLSYNGEIYNHQNLAQKHQINDYINDSDLLFKLLSLKGTAIVEEINGMFAFVWVDLKAKKTYLCRDHYGQKPLFYYQQKNTFFASSSLKALEEVIGNQNPTNQQIKHYLAFKYFPVNEPFGDIKNLSGGTLLCFDWETARAEKQNFKSPSTINSQINLALKDSIVNQTKDLKKVALLLSGGLDSSILALELCQQNINFEAFTLDLGSKSDDVIFAKKLSQQQGFKLNLVPLSTSHFNNFIASVDLPVGDSAFYLQYLLSQHIAPYSKVLLSGNAADELFGGYRRHMAFNQYLKRKKIWLTLSKISRRKGTGIAHFLNAIEEDSKSTFVNFCRSAFDLKVAHCSDTSIENLLDALVFDQKNYLTADLLSVADQSSMAFGLEHRSPYLDQAILWHAAIPTLRKKILKAPYQQALQKITKRKKIGFGVNFTSIWGKEKQEELIKHSVLLSAYLSANELQNIQKIIGYWHPKYSNEYWSLSILLNWLHARQ